jgi:hypothetical protein
MTYEEDYTIPEEIMEQICSEGFDALPELMRIVLNAAMYIERQKHRRLIRTVNAEPKHKIFVRRTRLPARLCRTYHLLCGMVS